MKLQITTSQALVLLSLGAGLSLTSANGASFIAYNDFFGNIGAASPNTTSYGANGSAVGGSGTLKDITTGANVAATLTVSGTTATFAE